MNGSLTAAIGALVLALAAPAAAQETPADVQTAPALAQDDGQTAAPPLAKGEAQIGLDAGNGAFLYGVLRRPEGQAAVPVVLIVPGSGGVDKNGDDLAAGVKAGTYRLLADALAARGIATLRADKRGVGDSAQAMSSEADLTLDTYVQDTVSWAKFLALQPRIKCVALLGHSEGALIAALAAHEVKTCGVIMAAGAGRAAADLIAGQLRSANAAGNLPKATYDEAIDILAKLRAGQTSPNPPPDLASLFRDSAQPYLISWLNRDPVEPLKTLPDVLVLQGDHDIQVSVDDARRLSFASRRVKLVILPGVNHMLKLAPADRVANIATYGDANLPLAPGVTSAIADFVLEKR